MNAEVEVEIDRHIGSFFLNRLKEAKQRLWIMSPWIAAEYMELAASKSASGVDVRVITTNDYVSGQKDALRKLIEGKKEITRRENKTYEYIGVGLMVLGFFLIGITKGISLIITTFGIILFSQGREESITRFFSKIGGGNLVVLQYHPYNVVHAKVYVVDDTVMIGSVNLTTNGLEHNIEGMAVLKNPDLAAQMDGMMGRVKHSLGMKELSYDEVGRALQIPDLPRKHLYHHRSFRWQKRH